MVDPILHYNLFLKKLHIYSKLRIKIENNEKIYR
jgi:hypothetical protein